MREYYDDLITGQHIPVGDLYYCDPVTFGMRTHANHVNHEVALRLPHWRPELVSTRITDLVGQLLAYCWGASFDDTPRYLTLLLLTEVEREHIFDDLGDIGRCNACPGCTVWANIRVCNAATFCMLRRLVARSCMAVISANMAASAAAAAAAASAAAAAAALSRTRK